MLALALVTLLSPRASVAQTKIVLSTPKQGRIDNLVPVMAQSARCMALGEEQGLLALGHDFTFAGANVSLVKLDAKGNPAAYTIPIKFPPRPAPLDKPQQYVNSVAFHPKLPLLYLWRDLAINYTNPPAPDLAGLKDFDHLLIYSVAKEPPELVAGLCRGGEYVYGQGGGSVFVDTQHLYVPNLRELKNAGSQRVGRFLLDADGLPDLGEKDGKLPLVARIKRLAELNAATPLSPHQLTPVEYVHLFNLNSFGAGMSYYPIGKDVMIVGNFNSIFTWRLQEKDCALSVLPLKGSGPTYIAAHPKLPALFATGYNTDSFFRAEQVEGYLTSFPRQYVIPEAKLFSPPAVLPKSNKLAVSGQHQVYLISLDEKGHPRDEIMVTPLLNPGVRGLIYSERFDRLYAAVDVSK